MKETLKITNYVNTGFCPPQFLTSDGEDEEEVDCYNADLAFREECSKDL